MVRPGCQIRKIRYLDLFKLRRLFKRALDLDFNYFPDNYLKEVDGQNTIFKLFTAKIRPNRILVGAWDNDKLIGYIIGHMTSKKLGQIFWLFVLPNYRGAHIGQNLLNTALQSFRDQSIDHVKLVTHKYKDYYLSQNFYQEKFYPKLIGDIDMYLMAIDLNKIP
ncbi:MAG: GNAT family N-acetyltransferase [bacterium]|nr:GNAT family N-acetyltransferase [bacterium]